MYNNNNNNFGEVAGLETSGGIYPAGLYCTKPTLIERAVSSVTHNCAYNNNNNMYRRNWENAGQLNYIVYNL